MQLLRRSYFSAITMLIVIRLIGVAAASPQPLEAEEIVQPSTGDPNRDGILSDLRELERYGVHLDR